ncbi:hypothetical protein FDP41_004610 [Naegleria fowleri]|uniref:Uncharacterized protein n=1 Tax=Naegleria fowleri TaxID=5763 RepID=A0A6A5BEZ5_NAEFO|nr:uncharacterized protein FDP41_004610 [Naegleria fowleri]KAF0976383.1 hypothetical protein FDP41_004610 [Naegleria fowleri]
MFHMLKSLGYIMKTYDHITFNHAGSFIESKTQFENTNEQDECLFKLIRKVMHLFSGRQVYSNKEKEDMFDAIQDIDNANDITEKWKLIPKHFELVWRRAFANRTLQQQFGRDHHSNNNTLNKKWKLHKYQNLTIKKSIMINFDVNRKWGKFCYKISPVINALAEKREINVVKSNECVEFRILMKHSNEDLEYVNHSELGNEIHSTITNQQLKDLGVIQLNTDHSSNTTNDPKYNVLKQSLKMLDGAVLTKILKKICIDA